MENIPMNFLSAGTLPFFLCAAVYAGRGWWRYRTSSGRKPTAGRFWFAMALGLALLGVIRTVRHQISMGSVAMEDESIPMGAGAYENGHDLQIAVICILAAACAIFVGMLRLRLWRKDPTKCLIAVGVIWLGFLTAVRSVSAGYGDEFFGTSLIGPLNLGHLVEDLCLILLACGAIFSPLHHARLGIAHG